MRRFSQRHPLVTLSDINITPLLDLAFVLLIIFVITSPLLEQGLDLDLPQGGDPDQDIQQENIRTVEVGPDGTYMLDGEVRPLAEIESALVETYQENPQLTVFIRADEATSFGHVFAVTDRCVSNGIRAVSFRAEPTREPNDG